MFWNLVFAFYGALAIAGIAWWRNALDMGGAAAAIVAGTVIFGLGGWGPSLALIFFFVSGSVLSALPNHASNMLPGKVHARTWKQVTANGFVPMLCILLARTVPDRAMLFLLAYYGSLAAACADTWGTEWGIRFGSRPRDILTGSKMEIGLSGGVSVVGTFASFAGAALIAAIAAISISGFHLSRFEISAIAFAGFLGSIFDSVLGSAIQAKYRIGSTDRIEENPEMSVNFELISGYAIVSNNKVNGFTSLAGAVFSLLISPLLG